MIYIDKGLLDFMDLSVTLLVTLLLISAVCVYSERNKKEKDKSNNDKLDMFK